MKVVIAPQSFKGGISGTDASRAIEEGVLDEVSDAETVRAPVADGGDGTLDALVNATGGEFFSSRVTGPLGAPVNAAWGAMGDSKTAVIEMARASGLALVHPRHRDPRTATSYGTGELIAQALDKGFQRIIVGLGGSATNDGGLGMAQALGVKFMDSNGRELPPGGAGLTRLHRIDVSGVRLGLMEAEIIAATDVSNPLCGPLGASAIYGPQKGASPETVEELDQALDRLSRVVERQLGVDMREVPRGGAAGGLAAGLVAFANARIESGIDLVCKAVGFEDKLEGADLVITGEGRTDASSVFEKAPVGVALKARERGIPVIALVGSLGQGHQDVYDHGINALVAIPDRTMGFDESMSRSYELLRSAAARTMRLLQVGGNAEGAPLDPVRPSGL